MAKKGDMDLDALIATCKPLVPVDKIPQESYEWAKKRVKDRFPKLKGKKISKAKTLYKHMGISYGFLESMKTGKFAPWPHEVEREAECIIYLACMYLMAGQIGLNPEMNTIFGARDGHKKKSRGKHHYEHAYVDVDVGATKRVVIDKQLGLFGFMKNDKQERLFTVQDNMLTNATVRHYDNLISLTEKEYVQKMNFLRSPPGQIKMLEEGQTIGVMPTGNTLTAHFGLMYKPKIRTLEEHMTIGVPLNANKLFKYNVLVDDEGNLMDDTVDMSVFVNQGWFAYDDVSTFGRFSYNNIKPIMEYFKKILVTKDSSSTRHTQIDDDKLKDYLISQGLNNDFTITDEKTLSKMISVNGLEGAIARLDPEMKENFDKQITSDKHILQGLSWNWMYEEARVKAIADGKDHDGFVFSRDQRDQYAKDAIDGLDNSWEEELRAVSKVHRGEIGMEKNNTRKRKKWWQVRRNAKAFNDKYRPTMLFYKYSKDSYDRIADVHAYIHKVGIASGKKKKAKDKNFIPKLNEVYMDQLEINDDTRKNMQDDLVAVLNKHGITEIKSDDNGFDEMESHIWWTDDKPDNDQLYPLYKQVIFKNIINMYQQRNNLNIVEKRKLLQDKFHEKWAYEYMESQIPNVEPEEADKIREVLHVAGEMYHQSKGNPLYFVAKGLQAFWEQGEDAAVKFVMNSKI